MNNSYVKFGSVSECRGCGQSMLNADLRYERTAYFEVLAWIPEHMVHTCQNCGWSYCSRLLKDDNDVG